MADMRLEADLAYAAWLADEEKAIQKNVVLARRYFGGDHDVPLTDRQREYLGFQTAGEERFALNFCRTVVTSVAERLVVRGFAGDDALAAWAWEMWQANRVDGLQMRVHEQTVCDGQYFVFVDYDRDTGRIKLLPHPRYTDPTVGGTGFGCKAHYVDDDPERELEYVSKRWSENYVTDTGARRMRQRMNVYRPDRVEKYVLAGSSEATWEPYRDEGDAGWPLPWVRADGEPLGIPVVHFLNTPDARSELFDAIPVQDAINKVIVDILAAADAQGFPILRTYGMYATTDGNPPDEDGSNYLRVHPGMIIGTTKSRAEAEISRLEAADPAPMLALLNELVLHLARVTDTPLSRFQVTGQVMAEATLKQIEGPLLAKVRARQTTLGNAWENVIYAARAQAVTFGGADLDLDAHIEALWEEAEVRDEKEFWANLVLKREKLGIPLRQIWQEAGYTPDQIADMEESAEHQARMASLQMAVQGAQQMGAEGG